MSTTPFEAWYGRLPSFGHFHIWGCKAEARFYNPEERKLDSRTESCYFIGYSEKSKGFKFYCAQSHTRIKETHNARFFEDQDVSDFTIENFIFEELEQSSNETSSIDHCPALVYYQATDQHVEADYNKDPDQVMEQPEVTEMEHEPSQHGTELINSAVQNDCIQVQPQIRKSTRTRKPAIPSDFRCHLQETDYNIGDVNDPMTYSQAMKRSQSNLWNNAMKEELESMYKNQVWLLVEPKSDKRPI